MKFVGTKNGQILFATDYDVVPAPGVTLISTFDQEQYNNLDVFQKLRLWRGSLVSTPIPLKIMRVALVGKLHANPLSALNYKNLAKITEHVGDWRLVPTPDKGWVDSYNPDYVIADLEGITEGADKWLALMNKMTQYPILLRTIPENLKSLKRIDPTYIAYNADEKGVLDKAGVRSVLVAPADVPGSYLGLLR